jgi:hypothetical protein
LNFLKPKVFSSVEIRQCLFYIFIHLEAFSCILPTRWVILFYQVFSLVKLQPLCYEFQFILLFFQIPIFTSGIRKAINCIWQYYSSIITEEFPYVTHLFHYIDSFGFAILFYIHSGFIYKLSLSANMFDHFQLLQF